MPTEVSMDTETIPLNRIWAVYNHLPGGQLVAIHFEDLLRVHREGNRDVKYLVTSKEQLEGFKKSPQVALNLNGKITKNEVLVYPGGEMIGNPRAANVAIEWAKSKGLQPIISETQKSALPFEQTRRIEVLETRVGGIEKGIEEIKELLITKK